MRGAVVPGVDPPLRKVQLQPWAVGSCHLQGTRPCLGFTEDRAQRHELLSETKQRLCLVCLAEGSERRKGTSGGQGGEEVLPGGLGHPLAAGPAAAHLPAPRPSS